MSGSRATASTLVADTHRLKSVLPKQIAFVRIRNYTSGDLDALRRLHAAQSFGYPFPDLKSPLFIAKLVLEDDEHADARPGASDPVPNSEPASRSTDFSRWVSMNTWQRRCSDHVRVQGGRPGTGTGNPQTKVCATDSAVASQVGDAARGGAGFSPWGFSQSRELADRREEADRDSLSADSAPTQHGRVAMAVLLRLTAETYLLHDPHAGTPRQRWQHLLALHEAAHRTAIACGLDDVQAFLPPRVARAFGRRLARLGWTQDPWPCFSRRLS